VLNYQSPTINPDDMLNGSFTGPVIAPVNQAMSQLPRTGGAGPAGFSAAAAATGNPNTVLYVWIGLFVLLVGTHMLTLSVQR
jgi:hypothetical protein